MEMLWTSAVALCPLNTLAEQSWRPSLRSGSAVAALRSRTGLAPRAGHRASARICRVTPRSGTPEARPPEAATTGGHPVVPACPWRSTTGGGWKDLRLRGLLYYGVFLAGHSELRTHTTKPKAAAGLRRRPGIEQRKVMYPRYKRPRTVKQKRPEADASIALRPGVEVN